VSLTSTGRVNQRRGIVEVGPPDTVSAARVKVGHLLRELLSLVAGDLANLEATAWTPVVAALGTADGILGGGAEVLQHVDLEVAGGSVPSFVVSNICDLQVN
jgi:hypothetical protein